MKKNYLITLLIMFVICSCKNGHTNSTETITVSGSNPPAELEKINKELASDPNNADLLHARALYYLNTKEYQNSFSDMMKVLIIDSSKVAYYLTLSDIYFYTNKTRNSKRALEKAIELDDKNTEALLKLAELYLYVKQNDKSIEYINKVLKIDQYNAKAYFMKGMNYKDLKDTAKAISSMQTAVEQDQNYYHAYMQLGILTAARKNPLALQYYKNAIRIQPNSIDTWYAIGKFYQDSGDWENAIRTYNELIALDSQNKYARYNLGVIYLINLKKYNLAVDHFTEAIQVAPNYTEAYYSRGLSYQAMGNTSLAIPDFQQCLRINPDYTPAQAELKQLNKLK
jgi:tetratricopeptide (TPR) repeat protein